MINPTEQAEREYLEEIKEKLVLAAKRIDDRVKQSSEELRQNKQYLHEHQSGLDEADMVAAEQSINRMAFAGESTVMRRRQLLKLVQSPWFGRIDFRPQEGREALPVYIGIHNFFDESQQANLIYDWRAPISSMFYDFELGEAWYDTPSGQVRGEIQLKRQYRIRDGRMEYMIENAMNIHDEVLQLELSKASDEKMRNIVATIQRDQNAVIRNESAPVMILQGVAGSGKTSIALHRIAFLLYRYRDTLTSRDILIISPNKVFADYISNVLPELGEEHIPETQMEDLAAEVLERKTGFQSFFQQVNTLLERPTPEFIERIRFKSSFEFLSRLNQYLIYIENNFFEAKDLRVGRVPVPSPFIEERFKAYHRVPLLQRVPQVVKDIQHYVRDQVQRKLTGDEKNQIWQSVPHMIRSQNVLELYKQFYDWLGRPHLFRFASGNTLEYGDVFPLVYCKIRLEGARSFDEVKHLLVDEMQDYTPVEYAVLSRLFKCRKTILGDVHQRVNPYSASSAEALERIFPQADIVRLQRSYRSTWEITMFAQRLFPNPDILPMERHGPEPQIEQFNSPADEVVGIRKLIASFATSGHRVLGVVCKTQSQARWLSRQLQDLKPHLLSADSTSFREGVVVTSAHLAKGLEFDEVIVPQVTAQNFRTETDKGMLYIACTRAMHLLTLTYSGDKTSFLT